MRWISRIQIGWSAKKTREFFFVFDLVPVHFFIINDVTFGFIQYIFMM